MTVETTSGTAPKKSFVLANRWFWIAAIVIVIILGGAWILWSQTTVGGTAGNQAASLEPAPVAGHPAPSFELKNLDGEVVRLSDFVGTPVIVNFWATWCGPCRAEFPDFQRTAVDNADGLVIIAVNHTTADQPSLVDDFVQEMGATFPVVLDENGEVVEAYKILGLPTTIFIDRNGIVNEVFTGPINQAYIEAKLSEL